MNLGDAELKRARLQLMNNRVAEGISADTNSCRKSPLTLATRGDGRLVRVQRGVLG